MKCMWTETWNKMLIQCEYKTNEPIDENGRAYCKEHRIKVDEINKSRHKNCINKEKLINFITTTLKENKESNSSDSFKLGKESVLFNLQMYIDEGDFDNE